jgi:hypothetical protein
VSALRETLRGCKRGGALKLFVKMCDRAVAGGRWAVGAVCVGRTWRLRRRFLVWRDAASWRASGRRVAPSTRVRAEEAAASAWWCCCGVVSRGAHVTAVAPSLPAQRARGTGGVCVLAGAGGGVVGVVRPHVWWWWLPRGAAPLRALVCGGGVSGGDCCLGLCWVRRVSSCRAMWSL